MDPIFDLATDLSQVDAFLLPIPHIPATSVRQSKRQALVRKIHKNGNEKPMKESETMKFFFMKIFEKISKFGNMAGWQLRPSSFRSSTIADIMVDTLKFTSKSKVWNGFCVGFIKKMSRHLSPDLYSGRAKGQVWGILLTITNDLF